MCHAAQARLDAADHNGYAVKSLSAALGVDNDGPVRPPAACVSRCIGIITANLTVSRITVDHRIHVAGSNPEIQVGRTKRHKIIGIAPVRLSNDAHTKTMGFQDASNDSHAETRMIDVGIPRDNDDIAAVPAQRIHFLPGSRQKRRHAKTLGPVRPIIGQGLCRLKFSHAVHLRTISGIFRVFDPQPPPCLICGYFQKQELCK